ncbi:MAG: ABC transporter substrate-binding protein [Candidatus Brocadiales bacterium]
MIWISFLCLFLCPVTLSGGEKKSLKVGFFPNVTHAQPLVGLARGNFQKYLGEDVEIKTKLFNAGPSVIEAIFAGDIDLAYVGPSPTINGFLRSNGESLRIVAGAAGGGVVFMVRKDVKIDSPGDLEGKTLATPQLGNTQDMSLRVYLKKAGLRSSDKGGKVRIIPVSNPDIINLFRRKQIDGAWVPEPWGARLVHEANGRVFLDERDLWPDTGGFTSTHIVATPEVLKEHPDVVEKWLKAHVEVTRWINAHPEEAKEIINSELKRITTRGLPREVLEEAFGRVEFTYEPFAESVEAFANYAYELGFLRNKPDLSNLYSLDLLNKVLVEDGLRPVAKLGD